MRRVLTLSGSMAATFTVAVLVVGTVSAKDGDLIQIAPASASAMRLVADKHDGDPLTQAARRAADDPYPDTSTLQILQEAHQRDEGEWEQAFANDMGSAFRQAADAVSVPYEYGPNHIAPDGWAITQQLANAVLRAKLPCASIYSVDSLRKAHGWVLVCDRKSNTYAIAPG